MESFNFLSFVVYLVAIWIVFKILLKFLVANDLEEETDAEREEKTDKERKDVVVVSIEKHGEIYYLFDRDNDSFIAQGKDEDELKEAVRKRFPNKVFMASEEHLKESGLKF